MEVITLKVTDLL